MSALRTYNVLVHQDETRGPRSSDAPAVLECDSATHPGQRVPSSAGRLHLRDGVAPACIECALAELRSGRATLGELPDADRAFPRYTSPEGATFGGPTGIESRLLADLAAAANSAGRAEAEALGKALDYLRRHPEHPAALALRELLQPAAEDAAAESGEHRKRTGWRAA